MNLSTETSHVTCDLTELPNEHLQIPPHVLLPGVRCHIGCTKATNSSFWSKIELEVIPKLPKLTLGLPNSHGPGVP